MHKNVPFLRGKFTKSSGEGHNNLDVPSALGSHFQIASDAAVDSMCNGTNQLNFKQCGKFFSSTVVYARSPCCMMYVELPNLPR